MNIISKRFQLPGKTLHGYSSHFSKGLTRCSPAVNSRELLGQISACCTSAVPNGPAMAGRSLLCPCGRKTTCHPAVLAEQMRCFPPSSAKCKGNNELLPKESSSWPLNSYSTSDLVYIWFQSSGFAPIGLSEASPAKHKTV